MVLHPEVAFAADEGPQRCYYSSVLVGKSVEQQKTCHLRAGVYSRERLLRPRGLYAAILMTSHTLLQSVCLSAQISAFRTFQGSALVQLRIK